MKKFEHSWNVGLLCLNESQSNSFEKKNDYLINETCFFADQFNCSDYCHLAWLIRDRQYLLKHLNCVDGAPKCSNGTSFENLDPARFAECPNKATVHNMLQIKTKVLLFIFLFTLNFT